MRLPRVLLAGMGALAMVGTNVATIQSANAATNLYEAESPANTLSGAATATACGPCLGGGMVGFTDDGAGSLQFNGVTASATGDATLTITYTGTAGRQARLSVNGGAPMTLDFVGTGTGAVVGTRNATVPLKAGSNTLTFTNAGGLAPGFDAISVASAATATGAGGATATAGGAPGAPTGGGTAAGGAAGGTSDGGTGTSDGGAAAPDVNAAVPGAGAVPGSAAVPGAGAVPDAGAGAPDASGAAAGGAVGGTSGPTASELLAATAGCAPVSNGSYENEGESGAVPVCAVKGAVVWRSGMSVDCDGQRSDQCNEQTDCCFAGSTAFQGPDGQPLDSASLPYIVVPGVSGTWNYQDAGVQAGSVAAVVYHNQVAYAVVGDVGPAQMIGEGSYALAQGLGISPDPRVGGAESGVTFIVFTGPGAVVRPIDSHAAAVALGERLARQLVDGG